VSIVSQQRISSFDARQTLFSSKTDGSLPLRDAVHLFHHWRDRTNAERMNRWLWVLLENH
jgi:hypothetical protein